MTESESILIAVGLILLNLLSSLWIRRNIRQLYAKTHSPEHAVERLKVMNQYLQATIILGGAVVAPFLLMPHLGRGGLDRFLMVLSPFVSYMYLFIQNVLLQYPLAKEIRGVTQSRKEMVFESSRILLFLLIPVGLYDIMIGFMPSGMKELFSTPVGRAILPILFILALSSILPLFQKKALKAHAMPRSELHDRLMTFVEKANVRNIRFFVWPTTKSRVANVLVSGYFTRRIFISDYVMENFTMDEIEAIVAHEIGHVKRHHMWVRLLLSILWSPLLQIIMYFDGAYVEPSSEDIAILLLFACAVSYLIVFYLFVSRLHEKEADAYVLKLGVNPATFIQTLLKVARLNHTVLKKNRLNEKFQTHPSVLRRMKWVAEQANLPMERMFQMDSNNAIS